MYQGGLIFASYLGCIFNIHRWMTISQEAKAFFQIDGSPVTGEPLGSQTKRVPCVNYETCQTLSQSATSKRKQHKMDSEILWEILKFSNFEHTQVWRSRLGNTQNFGNFRISQSISESTIINTDKYSKTMQKLTNNFSCFVHQRVQIKRDKGEKKYLKLKLQTKVVLNWYCVHYYSTYTTIVRKGHKMHFGKYVLI